MIRRLLSSRRFVIGISLLAIASGLIFLKSVSSGPGTGSFSPGYSVQPASYTPGYSVSYSSSSPNSLKEKISRKIDKVIELIDDVVD